MNVYKLPDGSILNLALVKKFDKRFSYGRKKWQIIADDDVFMDDLDSREDAERELNVLFQDLKWR